MSAGLSTEALVQNHYASQNVGDGGSTAYWAIQPSGDALVFVHGFGGAATDTWVQFPALLLQHPKCSNRDLIFYSYDSLYVRAYFSALDLYNFLNKLLSNPWEMIKLEGERTRPQRFAFRNVTLVAHSLGAIVCRQALLEATKDGRPWASHTSLVLFAPAHMGANVIRLGASLLFSLPPLGPITATYLQWRFIVLEDLEPGSQLLQDLLRETEEALLKDPTRSYLIARGIFFGKGDKVVTPNRFGRDPAPVAFPGRGHKDVCKPHLDAFPDPMDRLMALL